MERLSRGYDVGMTASAPTPRTGVAFLLAQLGAHAAGQFADRIAGLDLTPAQAGLLRMLAAAPGRSQRELAGDLGMPPSRFVPFADELEERGLIERRRNATDRRVYALHLTGKGEALLTELAQAGMAHELSLCEALNDEERDRLLALLRRIADQQGLHPDVHPGYRNLRPRPKP
ncbi:MarR family transcriptional regulator [Actinomadura sp. LCR2-06]|uniref:MarR family transcriptional regulator n=2 Tax=Actinomadura violacea TaxID=2819934 RepID=A0ABS3S9A0_9ACTN|nr:MarR family transcriptional regulator [Actinomadura violacea]